jgi:hypothetical protein
MAGPYFFLLRPVDDYTPGVAKLKRSKGISEGQHQEAYSLSLLYTTR